jgi:CDP-4-dehydro-6-deoxyglucose reductase, E1
MDYPTGFKSWGEDEIAAIKRVISSDRYTYGAETETFEAEIAAYHGRQFAVAVNSGSAANWVAIAALCHLTGDRALRRGDAVIAPAIAWGTTWSPLIERDFDIVLADVDDTWNAPVFPLGRYPDARLYVSCPVLGNPAHVEDWFDAARERGVLCLEDACESLGAMTEDGRRIGTLGDVSTLSFYMSHQLACGEGGAILTDHPEIYRLCRQIRSHGWTRDTDEPKNFADEYRFVVPGTNARPIEITMAVAREQLKKLDGFIAARRKNDELFCSMILDLPIRMQRYPSRTASPFGIAFTVNGGKVVRELLAAALRDDGIDCRLPTGGSARKHPMMSRWSNQLTPNADRVHDTGMFLGNAPFPIDEQVERAIKVMRRVLP